MDKARVSSQLRQHDAHLPLAEAELAQRGEDLGVGAGAAGIGRRSVGGAVGVAEAELGLGSGDDELAAVDGAVVGGAQRDEVRW